MDGFYAAESLEFLGRSSAVRIISRLQIAKHEFDGFEQTARCFGLPNFAKATPAQTLDEPVARNRFGVRFDPHRHGGVLISNVTSTITITCGRHFTQADAALSMACSGVRLGSSSTAAAPYSIQGKPSSLPAPPQIRRPENSISGREP